MGYYWCGEANKTTVTSQTSQLWSHCRSFEITLHMCCNSPKLCWLPFHRVKSRNGSASKIKRKLNCYASLSQNLRKRNHFCSCERIGELDWGIMGSQFFSMSKSMNIYGLQQSVVQFYLNKGEKGDTCQWIIQSHCSSGLINNTQMTRHYLSVFSRQQWGDKRGGVWRESVIMLLSKGKRPASAGTTQNMDWVNYARLEQIFLSPDNSVLPLQWTGQRKIKEALGLAEIFCLA